MMPLNATRRLRAAAMPGPAHGPAEGDWLQHEALQSLSLPGPGWAGDSRPGRNAMSDSEWCHRVSDICEPGSRRPPGRLQQVERRDSDPGPGPGP